MIVEKDIIERIHTDFGENANEALKLLTDTISQKNHLNSNRIIRCIVYLAKGNVIDLVNYIESAAAGPREVMFWAEYTGIEEKGKPRQLRDFSKTFDKCSIDLRK